MQVEDGRDVKIRDIINKASSILLGGVLWKAGGTINKNYRRIGFPLTLAIVCYTQTSSILASIFTFLIGHLALRIGYGIPDNTDEGSALGKFWFKIINNYRWTRILTRLVCGLAYSCSFIPILMINFEISKLTQAFLLPFFVILIVESEIGETEEIIMGSTFLGLYMI